MSINTSKNSVVTEEVKESLFSAIRNKHAGQVTFLLNLYNFEEDIIFKAVKVSWDVRGDSKNDPICLLLEKEGSDIINKSCESV